jgi:predicted nucleic acid-binding protein
LEESIFDTSELIELRKSGQREREGYTTMLNLIEFPKGAEFERLKVLYPTKEDYDTALIWSGRLLEKGKPVPAIDLIVSAVSARTGLELVTRDSHFREIKAIAKELKLQIKH